MNSGESIVEFFYNVVPGSLFLFGIIFFFDLDPLLYSEENFELITLFIYLVLSLFFGFLFQGITAFFRHNLLNWNDKAYRQVTYKNTIYEEAYGSFSKKLKLEKGDFKKMFYLMDTALRGETRGFLPTHFSSLFAFWSNLLCAILGIIIIVITLLLLNKIELDNIQYFVLKLLIPFAFLSFSLADKFLKSFYDSVLNSYYNSLPKTGK